MLAGIKVLDVVFGLVGALAILWVVIVIVEASMWNHLRRYESAYNTRFNSRYRVSFREVNRSFNLIGPEVCITGDSIKMYLLVRKMYRNKITREQLEQMSDTPYSKLPV